MKNLLGIKNIKSPHPTPLPLVEEGIIACHYEEQSDVVITFNKEITEQVRNDRNQNNKK